jgi:RNA polymerase sigma-70 factor (ECF subfamily)
LIYVLKNTENYITILLFYHRHYQELQGEPMLSFYLTMLDEESDKKRFEELYQKYREYMCKIALSLTDNETVAMDAVQDAFVAIAKNIDRIPSDHGREMERRYIRKIILNKLSNAKRKEDEVIKTVDIRDAIISDLECGDNDDCTSEVLNALKALPDIYTETLTLHYLYEIKVSDIAVLTGVSNFTVYSRIRRGIDIMKRMLGK